MKIYIFLIILMLSLFSIFWILNVFYQVISTFFVYGIQLCGSTFPALLREGLWLLFLFAALIIGYKKIKPYLKYWREIWIAFIILIIVSISFSILKDVSWSNIFIGIKYGFWWTFILISASFFGYVVSEKWQKSKLIKILPRVLVSIVGLGFLWQGAKLLRPDFFYSIGYGGLDDYSYGENPPIYYLTGYQGTLRRQGFFSGPNNYGYFLVAFLPLVRWFFTNNIKKRQNITLSVIALIVWLAGMGATLSRAALLGMVVVFIILYWKKLKEKKRLLLRGGVGILVALAVLSVLKRESTIGHITSKLSTIPEVVSQPLGHGLGSSGPAIHYEGKYLPENYFLQIMLDVGTVGFLFWVFSMMCLLLIQHKILGLRKGKTSAEEDYQLQVLHKLQVGFFALFIMGLFLHVFEDSMVNYLFFTIYGIILGSLSTNLKGELSWKKLLGMCINNIVQKTRKS